MGVSRKEIDLFLMVVAPGVLDQVDGDEHNASEPSSMTSCKQAMIITRRVLDPLGSCCCCCCGGGCRGGGELGDEIKSRLFGCE